MTWTPALSLQFAADVDPPALSVQIIGKVADPTLSLTSRQMPDHATALRPGPMPPPCGTECPGGHDSLPHLAFTTEFAIAHG